MIFPSVGSCHVETCYMLTPVTPLILVQDMEAAARRALLELGMAEDTHM